MRGFNIASALFKLDTAARGFGKRIAQVFQYAYKFTGTTTTNADGSRELVNTGTGENALMQTGVTFNAAGSVYAMTGIRAFNRSRVFRAYLDIPDSPEFETYGVAQYDKYALRFGKTSSNDWRFYFGYEGVGLSLDIPRTKADAVLLISVDVTTGIADCYIDGVFVGSLDASAQTQINVSDEFIIGAYSRGIIVEFVGKVGYSWMMSDVTITDPQQAMDDYLYPEKTFYRNDDDYILSDVFTDPAELAIINDGDNDRGFAVPVTETGGNELRDIIGIRNLTLTNYVDDSIYTTDLSKDYQNAFISTDTTNHYKKNYDFEEITADSFAELPLILNVSTYSFAEEAPNGDLVLTLLYPPSQRNPLQTEWYVSPTGSNYTGTGQSDSPLKDLNAIKYILDIYEGDTATDPLTFYLMDGEHERQVLYRTNFQNTTVKIDPAATADVIVNGFSIDGCTNLTIDGQTQSNTGLNIRQRSSSTDYGIVLRKPLEQFDYVNPVWVTLVSVSGNNILSDSLLIKNLYSTGLQDHLAQSYDDWTTIDSVHNIYAGSFRAFDFTGMNNSTIQNNYAEGCGYFMSIERCENLTIENNEANRWFLDGIVLGYELPNLTIRGNYIHDVYEITGVHSDHLQSFGSAQMDNLLIENNVFLRSVETTYHKKIDNLYVHNMTLDNPSANGLIVDANNAGYGDGASGVGGYTDSLGYLRNVNDEYYVRSGYPSQGMFNEGTVTNGKIINNVVHPSNSVYGISCPNNSTNLLVAHNTTIASRINSPYIAANNVTIANNACAIVVQGRTLADVTLDSNYTALTSDDLVDRDFTDGNFDLQLVANITGSSAYLADVPDDINGTTRANPPSVGAYEYVVVVTSLLDSNNEQITDSNNEQITTGD